MSSLCSITKGISYKPSRNQMPFYQFSRSGKLPYLIFTTFRVPLHWKVETTLVFKDEFTLIHPSKIKDQALNQFFTLAKVEGTIQGFHLAERLHIEKDRAQ